MENEARNVAVRRAATALIFELSLATNQGRNPIDIASAAIDNAIARARCGEWGFPAQSFDPAPHNPGYAASGAPPVQEDSL